MDKRTVARAAITEVNHVRDLVVENRERWSELEGILGINKRWLRAFASGQIQQPPASRFLVIYAAFGRKKGRAVARPA